VFHLQVESYLRPPLTAYVASLPQFASYLTGGSLPVETNERLDESSSMLL
jgi:hypothetical protein